MTPHVCSTQGRGVRRHHEAEVPPPEGLPFMDWPFTWYSFFTWNGLAPIDRIMLPWPTSIWQAFHVERAKENRQILPLAGDCWCSPSLGVGGAKMLVEYTCVVTITEGELRTRAQRRLKVDHRRV